VTITASDIIAVVAILAGIVTTSVVALIGHLDRNGDHKHDRLLATEGHEHERSLAREARLQERRESAYLDMLDMAFRIQLVVGQTMPVLELLPAPPRASYPPADEQRATGKKVALFGSPEVVALYRALMTQTREFQDAVLYVNLLHPDPSVPPIGDADMLKNASLDVQKRKVTLNAAVDELERVAREELAS
jgi:hypothetical protein